MDEPRPGPSGVPEVVSKQDTVTSEDSESIPFADSPDTPPRIDIRKASLAVQQPQLHDGIILLITSDSESQRSPNGSVAPHPLSEFYLLPLPQDALSTNRRYSLQDRSGKDHHYLNERKASCPDTELRLSPDRSRRSSICSNRKSDLDISKDRLTPTSFSGSRRSSNASICQHSSSRRSSNASMIGHHRRRSSNCTNCSRRSSNSSVSHSRRSSTASHRSSPTHGSRRSSNCSRRSSHCDSDEESYLHHHHHHRRGSRYSLEPLHRGSIDRRGSRIPSPQLKKADEDELDEREELEMGGIPLRHRRIIIMIIGSVSIFILVMSVVLIAVSLTLSPTIDDLGESFIYFHFIFNITH